MLSSYVTHNRYHISVYIIVLIMKSFEYLVVNTQTLYAEKILGRLTDNPQESWRVHNIFSLQVSVFHAEI